MRALSFHDPAFLRRVAGGGGGGGGGGSTLALADMGAFWRFNEASATDNAVDATGGGATLVASTGISSPTPVAGQIDGAREVGHDPYFESASLSQLHLTASDSWSLFGWVKVTDNSGNLNPVFAHGPLDVPAYSVEPQEGAYIRLHSFYFDATAAFTVAVDCNNVWAFFAVGYDAAQGKGWISVNGGARVYRTWGSYAVPDSGDDYVRVGLFPGLTNTAKAAVDSLGWLKAKLTDAQISWLWNGGAGRDITA